MPQRVRPNVEWKWDIPKELPAGAKGQKMIAEAIAEALEFLRCETRGDILRPEYHSFKRISGRLKVRPCFRLRYRVSPSSLRALHRKDEGFNKLLPQSNYDD